MEEVRSVSILLIVEPGIKEESKEADPDQDEVCQGARWPDDPPYLLGAICAKKLPPSRSLHERSPPPQLDSTLHTTPSRQSSVDDPF